MEPFPLWRVWTPIVAVTTFWLVCILRPLPFLRIVGLCMAALVAYGMLQDQVSARLCPEYFTVAHRPIEGLHDPTWLAVTWGFLGSWWGGLFLGVAVAIPATVGSRPRLELHQLLIPLGVLLLFIAGVTLICGLSVHYNAQLARVSIGTSRIPPERHQAFLVVACAHGATYVSSVVGAVVLSIWVGWQRRSLPSQEAQ